MRAVLAKQLRKKARELSVGMPERRLVIGAQGTGKTKAPYMIAINDPQSFRGIYRAMKKYVKGVK